jgi:hypothetical protein
MKLNKWFTTVVIAVCGFVVTGCASQVPTAPTKVLVAPTDKRLTAGEVPTWLPNGSVVATGPCADETVMAYSVRIPTQTTTWSWGVPPGLAVPIVECRRWLARYQQMAESDAVRNRYADQAREREQCQTYRRREERAVNEWQQCRQRQFQLTGNQTLSSGCADVLRKPEPSVTTYCR